MEQLNAIIDLLKAAVAAGQTFTITADDIEITTKETGVEITANNVNVSTES